MAEKTNQEIDRLWSETRRLNAETIKLLAEENKLAAEKLRRQRTHFLPQWVMILLWIAVGAGLAYLLFSVIEGG